jgi:hypothetical protein
MSTRERWIVYPLLFLALGIAMRDKVIPPKRLQVEEVVAERMRCKQLQADQEIATGLVRSSQLQADQAICKLAKFRAIQCEEFAIAGPNARPVVLIGAEAKTKGGLIMTLSSKGVPQVLLKPTDSGGVVVASEYKQVKVGEAPPEQPKTTPAPATNPLPKETEKATPTKPTP